MLAELEKSIADRVRSVIPLGVARVRAFSETTQLEDGRAETLGSIVIGYVGSQYSNSQPPYIKDLTFSVVISLKNLRTHQPSLQILDLITQTLVDFVPSGGCGTYFPQGLAPQTENFIKLEKDGSLYLWEQIYSLKANATVDVGCCINPELSYRDDIIGFYRPVSQLLTRVRQKLWKWVAVSSGAEVIFPESAEANLQFVSFADNMLSIESGQSPQFYTLLDEQAILLCTRPETGEVVDCQLGVAPLLPPGWLLERVSPTVVSSIA